MGYLEQFARNRRSKEKTEVLTARLPAALYSEFKTYCDELGLSISEAVCLLVEHELKVQKSAANTESNINDYENKQYEYEKNNGVFATNTNVNTKAIEKTQAGSSANAKRFTVKQFVFNNELPCPVCNQWVNNSNFARHAKQHGSSTQAIFTNEKYLKQVNEMIEERKAIHQGS